MAEPALYLVSGGAFSLSDAGLQSLLGAVLAKGYILKFQANGTSMSPLIQDGDTVMVSPIGNRGVRVGEVVAFCHPATRKLTIHRVVASPPDGFVVRGDNSSAADGVISREDILGLVTAVQRNGKRVAFGIGPERHLIALALHRKFGRRLTLGVCRIFGRFLLALFPFARTGNVVAAVKAGPTSSSSYIRKNVN